MVVKERSLVMVEISQLAVFSSRLGLFGMRITEDRMVRSRLLWSLNLIRMFLLIALHFWRVSAITGTNITMSVTFMGIFLSYYVTVLSCGLVSMRIREFNSFLRNVSAVDNYLRKHCVFVRPNVKKLQRIQIAAALFPLGLNLYKATFSSEAWDLGPLEILLGYWPAIEVTTLNHQLTALVGTLSSRLTATIRLLYSPVPVVNAVKCHELIVRGSEHLQEVFKLQFLLLGLSAFSGWVGNLYIATDALELASLLDLIIEAARGIVALLLMAWLVDVIHEVSKKSKEFNSELYQLMIDDPTSNLATNIKLRLHVAMKREIKFTAYGFFTIDYTLVHSMIAAATTYLVILLQFGHSPIGALSLAPSFPPNATTISSVDVISTFQTYVNNKTQYP